MKGIYVLAVAIFTVLAIIISCLDLFGIASFMTEWRSKEIGVRKVVGASVFSLWKLMSTEFVMLVALSFAMASPIAFILLNSWMEVFTYRAEISWEIFAAAGIVSIVITLATVSFLFVKAAYRNPVCSLRSE